MLQMVLRSLGCACILVVVLCAGRAEAASVTLAWDPSTSPNVAGYTVKYGTVPGSYPNTINAGNTTSFTLSSLSNGTYYFVVQAYATDGTKSPHSDYLVVTIGVTAPSTPPPTTTPPPPAPAPAPGCTTPDPFASMGGGTCYNGGWLPPGMMPPGSSPAPAPSPSPAPSPAPSTGGCTTPDPFATLGGGVCYNGGWLPPGMAPPASTPSPAPSPAPPSTPPPATPPPPPPAPSSGTCTTPDPFAALGGGTCYNGAWLPPGMTPPVTSKPAPGVQPPPVPSPSAPVAPPTNVTCTIADPFASMGGGTCYNGGWLPPGMPVPGGGAAPPPSPTPSSPSPSSPSTPTACATPDPFVVLGGGTCYNGGWLPPGMVPPDQADEEITVTGTIHVLDAERGVWMIEAEDGTLYTSTSEIPEEIVVTGTIVTFRGIRLPAESADQEFVIVEIIAIDIAQ
jgi:hypothetical protein